MKAKSFHVQRSLAEDKFNGQELGQTIGLIYLADEKFMMYCSFCKSVKQFNEVLSFISHIRSSHGFLGSEILTKSKLDIEEKFVNNNLIDSQDNSLNLKINKQLLEPSAEFNETLLELNKNETSTPSLKPAVTQHFQQNLTTKFSEKKLLIKCDKSIDESFNNVDIHPEQFYCTNCKLNFQLENQLLEHICSYNASTLQTTDPKRKSIKLGFQCEICSATLTSKRNLQVHLQRHKGERSHKCQYCSKGFYTLTNLKSHLVTHTLDRDYKCEYCDKTFGVYSSLWRHTKLCHPEQSNKNYRQSNHKKKRNPISSKPTANEMSTSSLKPADEHHLQQNLTTKSSEKNILIQFDKNVDESFKDIDIHSEEFYCTNCKLNFQKKNQLLKHICSYNASSLQESVPNRNSKKLVFLCEICSAILTTKRNLQIHLQRHTGKGTHKCQYCPKGFFTITELKNHLVTHTHERDYKCEYCDQTFGINSSVWLHKKLCHPEQSNKK